MCRNFEDLAYATLAVSGLVNSLVKIILSLHPVQVRPFNTAYCIQNVFE
jgi:hypothetical protein